MTHLTIRNLPGDVAAALDTEKRRRGTSMNRTVIELLRQSLHVGEEQPRRSNGLASLGSKWTQTEFEEFEAAIAWSEEIDPEMWQ
jgi:plasmid stability protein